MKVLFIHLSIRIFSRKLYDHASGISDNLSCQKYVLQPERFDLLLVFRSLCKVHLEQQKQIVCQHHQLKDGFIGPKGLEQEMPNGHVILGFFDVILSIAAFFVSNNHFF
jgi:hypothetical protein